jgi:hypothetical protein
MKAIRTWVENIRKEKINWRLIKQCKSNGDSKFIEVNGSRS